MDSTRPRRIAVITGTRAEYGLLRPVMLAIAARPDLDLRVVAAGSHLLMPARTIDEVAADFHVDATVEMQREGAHTRIDDARALGRGLLGMIDAIESLDPEVILVLGDRIEAFAAASAASIAGVRVAHVHGGDRAEGIADESIRHAITKLSHIHFTATAHSTERVIAMGEEPLCVHLVGSPAIDELSSFPPLDDRGVHALGRPEIVVLHHPLGRSDAIEEDWMTRLLTTCMSFGRVLALHPNHDPGRDGILRAIEAAGCPSREHLARPVFVGLLARARLLVGNSSAGLIEAAAIGVRVVNVGSRQAGREMPGNVVDVPVEDVEALTAAILRSFDEPRWTGRHPYGDGRSGRRIAGILATFDTNTHPIRKRNSY
jgi:UDP-hydrolysing UDP-N-acetyl-D-glucosamine 2-epimerase